MTIQHATPAPGTIFEGGPLEITEALLGHYLLAVPTDNRLHLDDEWVRTHTPFPRRIVPAPLTLALVCNLMIKPGRFDEWALGLLELLDARYPAPVHPGVMLSARCTIALYRAASKARGVIETLDEGRLADGTVVYRGRRRILARGRA